MCSALKRISSGLCGLHKPSAHTQTLKFYCTTNKNEDPTWQPENPDRRKRKIEIELQMLREEGEYFVPDKISDQYWRDLLQMPTKRERMGFYRFLKKTEIYEEKRDKRKRENLIRYAQRVEALESTDHIKYGLRNNSMFYKIRDTAMDRFYNCNVLSSILFGAKLVLDFGYHENMNQFELKSCIKQVQELYGFNKVNREPFDLYFCNLAPDGELDRKLSAGIGNLRTSKCLVTTSRKSYLDLFPRDKLVYLTPDCMSDLNSFDCDDVYIVGGLVDRNKNIPLALSKAKREGLRMARLPLEKYLNWGTGNKSLTLDQIVKILLTFKNSRSWVQAFQHIPGRKLKESPRRWQ